MLCVLQRFVKIDRSDLTSTRRDQSNFEGDSPAMSLKSRQYVALADASRRATDSTVWLVCGRRLWQLISALREDD